MAYTCPRCERTSHHPEDARQGYCGACGDWTGQGVPGEGNFTRFYQCETCGNRTAVPPEHAGRVWCPCGSARAMTPAPWVVAAEAEFRPSDIRVPDGTVVLWQFAGPAEVYVPREFVEEHPGPRPRRPAALARYVGERYGAAVPLTGTGTGSVTGSQRSPGSDSESPPADRDDISWSDAATWLPGYREL